MSRVVHYITYDMTGLIIKTGTCPDRDINRQVGGATIEGKARDDLNYIDLADPANPAIADKTLVPHTVTGGNIITLPGDALHCEVAGPIADSFDIPAGETELTFTADVPGQYTLMLSGVKYLPTEVQVAI